MANGTRRTGVRPDDHNGASQGRVSLDAVDVATGHIGHWHDESA